MTALSHLSALEKRHEQLEQQIDREMRHPSHDDLKVRELKRRKLELKDEISRLQRATTH